MYRRTYALIDENILKSNVEEIKSKYTDYKYYIGVVKNNAYNHGIHVVNALIEGGINYLAVSSLEEAIMVRKYNRKIPVLCLEVIDLDYIYDCINNNVTITVESLSYLEELNKMKLDYEIKIHLKLNTGMNRLGMSSKKDVNKCVEIINKNKKLFLEGIYTHLATSGISDKYYDNQIDKLECLKKTCPSDAKEIVKKYVEMFEKEIPDLLYINPNKEFKNINILEKEVDDSNL